MEVKLKFSIYPEMFLTVPPVKTKYSGFGPDHAESLHVEGKRD